MSLLTLTWKTVSKLEADLLENGAQRKNWVCDSDARIKTIEAPLGIGPAVYIGRPEDNITGEETYSGGVIRDALFLFFDDSNAVYAILENVDPSNLVDTIDNYMLTHGGNIETMKALKPS